MVIFYIQIPDALRLRHSALDAESSVFVSAFFTLIFVLRSVVFMVIMITNNSIYSHNSAKTQIYLAATYVRLCENNYRRSFETLAVDDICLYIHLRDILL